MTTNVPIRKQPVLEFFSRSPYHAVPKPQTPLAGKAFEGEPAVLDVRDLLVLIAEGLGVRA